MHGCMGCKERLQIRRSDGPEAAVGAIGQSWLQSSRPIPSACRAETPLHRLSIACGNGGQSGPGIAGGRVGPHPVPGGLQGGVEGPEDPDWPRTDHKLSCQEAGKWKHGPWPVQIRLIGAKPSCNMLTGRVQGTIVQPPASPSRQTSDPSGANTYGAVGSIADGSEGGAAWKQAADGTETTPDSRIHREVGRRLLDPETSDELDQLVLITIGQHVEDTLILGGQGEVPRNPRKAAGEAVKWCA